MESVATPFVVTFISALFTLGGVSGITQQDVSGFVNVLFGFMTLAGIVWSWFAHRAKVKSLTGTP